METRELTPNLAKAIISVMKEVDNIEKSMTVGKGENSYKGVSDKDVKLTLGRAMAKHGLCIMPISVKANLKMDRWEEVDPWSKETPKAMKTKQSVFVDATCEYLLLHESGESQVIAGYGNGVDSQDKAAGKATTYSLKNALLYMFMVPTGEIDDADKTHSDEHPVPQKSAPTQSVPTSPTVDYAQYLRDALTLTSLVNVWNAIPSEHKPTHLATKEEMKQILAVVEELGKIKTLLKLDAYVAEFEKGEFKDNVKLKALIDKRRLDLTGKA